MTVILQKRGWGVEAPGQPLIIHARKRTMTIPLIQDSNTVRQIPLSQGLHTLVDVADYESLSQQNWHKRIKKWQTRIRENDCETHLGYFHSETDAALAYNEAAKKYHGEFARLNEIESEAA